ncbi:MAG: RseA family anti-sigma factor, partial [Steroidobacteraceae bacterium]
MKRVALDRGLAVRWARYHVVRQVLRHHEMMTMSPHFADAVMATLARESTARSRSAPMWLRWGTGGAIAASVAVAALMVTRPAGEVASPSGFPHETLARAIAPSASANLTPLAAARSPGEFHTPLLAPNIPETAPASFGTDLAQPIAIDPQMQSYMLRHYQAIGGSGSSAFVPYVLLGAPQPEAGTT